MRLVVIVCGDEESESLVLSVMVSVINLRTFLLENQIHKNAKSFSSLYPKRQKIFYMTYPKLVLCLLLCASD